MTRPMSPAYSRRRFLASCAALPWLAACERDRPPVFLGMDVTGAGFGRGFRLRDPDGRERTLADFRGKAVMVFFGFTQCPDVCPTALTRAVEVKRLLGSDGDRLQVLFVSLDPERDTPVILKAYTGAFDPTFLGLYGDLQQTAAMAKDFNVYYKKVPTGDSYTLDHSAMTYVYDPEGHLRLMLRHTQTAGDYAADIRKLLHPD